MIIGTCRYGRLVPVTSLSTPIQVKQYPNSKRRWKSTDSLAVLLTTWKISYFSVSHLSLFINILCSFLFFVSLSHAVMNWKVWKYFIYTIIKYFNCFKFSLTPLSAFIPSSPWNLEQKLYTIHNGNIGSSMLLCDVAQYLYINT